MISEKGKAEDLLDVGRKFLEFAKKSSPNTKAWEVVDDRVNSFYGGTIKIPMNYSEGSFTEKQFYISLQFTKVDMKDTYHNWLYTGSAPPDTRESITKVQERRKITSMDYMNHHYLSEAVEHSQTGNSGVYNRIIYCPDMSWGKYGKAWERDPVITSKENLFKDSGEFLAVGIHTHFDKGLWMCEQGGIQCSDHTDHYTNKINLMKLYQYESWIHGGWSMEMMVPRSFPATGCNWLCKSANDDELYSVSTNKVKYWFTKTDYNATITICLHNYDIVPDAYHSISLGIMEGVDYKYTQFPLYICGGSQGIANRIWNFHLSGYGRDVSFGNVYDLSIRNPALANSSALYPTKFNGAENSNFKVMASNGEWQDVYSKVQNAKDIYYFSCGGSDYLKGYPLLPPEETSQEKNSSYIFATDNSKMIDSYTTRTRLNQYTHSTPLNKFVVAINLDHFKSEGRINGNGQIGVVPNIYYSWSRTMPSGEVEINGKKYLSVPNGWDGRVVYYPYHLGGYFNEEWNQDQLRDQFEVMTNKSDNKQYVHKILIPLEEGG